VKVLIVDDEPLARERLQRLLSDIDGVDAINEADSGHTALAAIKTDSPDLILLDIRMPGIDGMELAHRIQGQKQRPYIIFTTAYSEHALDAFGVDAVDYLLKPIRKEKLAEAIRKVEERMGLPALPETPMLRATERDKITLILLDDVLYFQADSKYVTACLRDHNLLLEESLKQLELRFGAEVVRVHRNALVPRQQLGGTVKLEDGEQHIQLRDGQVGPAISRRHLPEIRKLLKNRAS
jgi:two-component system response regulator AlgR